MSHFGQRSVLLETIADDSIEWDIVVVGGGITGAAVLLEASRLGLKALLVEQQDFAWGTSSRSSKMVHGGLRYLAQGNFSLTRHSLLERERLLHEAPGLVERLGYLFAIRKNQFPGKFIFSMLLKAYDFLAGIKDNKFYNLEETQQSFPGINDENLKGACYYTDATTDDSRLVLRVLQEAIDAGGIAINYAKGTSLIKDNDQVVGINVQATEQESSISLRAKVVVNATGAWSDDLRKQLGIKKEIRPLRGSHLIIPSERLPIKQAMTLLHPTDKRAMFMFPWEGRTVIGTTDLDHKQDLNVEAAISQEEVDYLITATNYIFPKINITEEDVISSFSGVRPVISSGESKDPSKETREHAIWVDKGLVTVSGGKLTTFRIIAHHVLDKAIPLLASNKNLKPDASQAIFSPAGYSSEDPIETRLIGRIGRLAKDFLRIMPVNEQVKISDTHYSLSECRWAARHEAVLHLDDLLLRRTRLGLLLPKGAVEIFVDLKQICKEELSWDDDKWHEEETRYHNIWNKYYYLPK